MTTNGQTATKVPATVSSRQPYPAHTLRNAINRLFDDFGLATPGFRWPAMAIGDEFESFHAPKIDVKEMAADIVVTAELPGMDVKDIDLNLFGDHLVVRGEKKQDREENEGGYHRTERTYGYFERTVRLPAEVQREKIDASYKDGVLRVTMPKTNKAVDNSKKIEIKAHK